jgi:hypothetical protein
VSVVLLGHGARSLAARPIRTSRQPASQDESHHHRQLGKARTCSGNDGYHQLPPPAYFLYTEAFRTPARGRDAQRGGNKSAHRSFSSGKRKGLCGVQKERVTRLTRMRSVCGVERRHLPVCLRCEPVSASSNAVHCACKTMRKGFQ